MSGTSEKDDRFEEVKKAVDEFVNIESWDIHPDDLEWMVAEIERLRSALSAISTHKKTLVCLLREANKCLSGANEILLKKDQKARNVGLNTTEE